VASWVRQRPPAPRKVGKPELAESPAPKRATMRRDLRRWAWKSSSMADLALGSDTVEAILVEVCFLRCWRVMLARRESIFMG